MVISMSYDILINFLSDFNIHNLIAVESMKPQKVVFIYLEKEEEHETFQEIKEFLRERDSNIEIIGETIQSNNILSIEEIIKKYKDRNLCINLSGGSRIMGIIACQLANKYNIPAFVIDMKNKSIIGINNRILPNANEAFNQLTIDDFIESTGGEILSETTFIMELIIKSRILDYIVENLKEWIVIKEIFKNRKIVSSYSENQLDMFIRWKKLDYETAKIAKEFMYRLEKFKLIYVYNDSIYGMKFRFRNIGIKKFFLVSGSWLESLVYKIIKDISIIDDVKSGVIFVWDDDTDIVKNELDILATIDSTLLCISCKDTSKYDEDDLNELEVYSERIGGKNSVKILVATQEPYKTTIYQRAQELNIHLILFNGDIDDFKRKIEKLVKMSIVHIA